MNIVSSGKVVSGDSYNFQGIPGTDRLILVQMITGSSAYLSSTDSLTIGGVAGTEIAGANLYLYKGFVQTTSLFYFLESQINFTGSQPVVLNVTGAPFCSVINIIELADVNQGTALDYWSTKGSNLGGVSETLVLDQTGQTGKESLVFTSSIGASSVTPTAVATPNEGNELFRSVTTTGQTDVRSWVYLIDSVTGNTSVLFDYDNPDVITGGHDTKRVYAVTLDTKPSVANYAPVITDLSDVVVTVGDTINISLAATDPDVGDVLTYTADVLPSGISIVNNVLVGNYGAEETLTTTITVADDSGIGGTDTDTTTMMFTVVGVGRSLVTSTVDYANLSPDSPLIDAISDGDFEVGDQLDFPAIVDGRTVFFGSDGLITVSGVGDVTIPDIYIRDKSNSYDRVGPFSITLAEVVVNSAPVITSGGSVSVVAGSSTTYTAAATDSNGDAIAFSIANSPAWVSISGTTVSIDASAQSAGSYSFDLVASDGNGGSVSQTVTIAVTAVADTTAPVITVAGGTTAMTVGGVYTPPMVTALDNVDGDITGSIVTTGTAVNPSVAGTYTLIYNVVDGAGTPALQKTHTVVVSPAVVVSDPVRLVIDGDNTLIDLKGELLTHTYADWFVTDSDIDATNKAGSALNIVATGELLEVVDGVGAVQVAGPVVGNVYTLVVYTIPPGQSQPTHYQRVMLTAQAVA